MTIFGAKTKHNRNSGKLPRACSKSVIDTTVYWVETGQKLVRSRSNYFDHDRTTLLMMDNAPLDWATVAYQLYF